MPSYAKKHYHIYFYPHFLFFLAIMTSMTQCVLSISGKTGRGALFAGARKVESGRGSKHYQQIREAQKILCMSNAKAIQLRGTPND